MCHKRDSLFAYLPPWCLIFIEMLRLAGLATTNRFHEHYRFDQDSSPNFRLFPGKIPLEEKHKIASFQLMSTGEFRTFVLTYQANPHKF
jgi:hypothetical protein